MIMFSPTPDRDDGCDQADDLYAGRLYYGISEVASRLGVEHSLLRLWEKRFKCVTPLMLGKRRYYRLEDVVLLQGICRLLFDELVSIEGLQRFCANKVSWRCGSSDVRRRTVFA